MWAKKHTPLRLAGGDFRAQRLQELSQIADIRDPSQVTLNIEYPKEIKHVGSKRMQMERYVHLLLDQKEGVRFETLGEGNNGLKAIITGEALDYYRAQKQQLEENQTAAIPRSNRSR